MRMQAYRAVGLVLVVGGLGFVAGMHFGAARQAAALAVAAGPAEGSSACCTVGPSPAGPASAAPAVPTGSGRPCLAEFGSDECDACKRMQAVLAEAEQHFSGVVDLVRVDTDIHPAEAQRWRLRMVPTQILVDASGTELWRHEGYLPFDELRTEVERHRDSGQSGQGQ